MEKIVQLEVEKLLMGPNKLRLAMEDEALYELRASIRRIGIIVPLIVVAAGENFTVVAGHRRLQAAVDEGFTAVPVIIKTLDDAKTTEISLAENLFREDLTPVEQACAIKDILDKGTMKIPEVARVMHRTERWVQGQLNILSWPADVLDAVHKGVLSVAAASNLALITDDSYRFFLLRNADESGATARTTAAWLQAWRSYQPPEEAVTAEPVPAGASPTPAVPQAPCIMCGNVFRTDELSHVPICVHCVRVIRDSGAGG